MLKAGFKEWVCLINLSSLPMMLWEKGPQKMEQVEKVVAPEGEQKATEINHRN